MIDRLGTNTKNALRWIPKDLPDNKATLVQVMALCCQENNIEEDPWYHIVPSDHNEFTKSFNCWWKGTNLDTLNYIDHIVKFKGKLESLRQLIIRCRVVGWLGHTQTMNEHTCIQAWKDPESVYWGSLWAIFLYCHTRIPATKILKSGKNEKLSCQFIVILSGGWLNVLNLLRQSDAYMCQ